MEPAFQCLDRSGLMAQNPFDMLQNYCDANDALHFEVALEKYEQCSGADIVEFIQTIASAGFGALMTCSGYIFNELLPVLEQEDPNMMFPLPRMPQECVESFLGDNAVGK